VRATTRSGGGPHRAHLGLTVATGLAIALSLSGFALANELPRRTTGSSHHAPATPLEAASPLSLDPRASGYVLALRFVPTPGQSREGTKEKSGQRAYGLPVARRLIDRSQLDRPHHDYPAWDLAVPVGTKVVGVHAGVVDEVTDSGNCGHGVVVAGSDDYQYTYCHGSKVLVRKGDRVSTGELLMLSGSSGHSTGPHLHLQIENSSGTLLCPQSLVTSWFNGGQASPDTAISTGCFYISVQHAKHHRHRHHHHRSHRRASNSKPSGSTDASRTPSPNSSPSPKPSAATTPSPKPSPAPTSKATPSPKPSPSLTPLPVPSPSPTLP
jgi:murein DD-endopeptidase MepM/ murein hydrolase activator NlpD